MAETVNVQIRDGLSVDIGALTTREAMQADGIIGSLLGEKVSAGGLALLTTKVYSICSVRQMNGVHMAPLAGEIQFDAVCNSFSLLDLVKLQNAYDDNFGVKVEKLKNDSGSAEGTTAT